MHLFKLCFDFDIIIYDKYLLIDKILIRLEKDESDDRVLTTALNSGSIKRILK